MNDKLTEEIVNAVIDELNENGENIDKEGVTYEVINRITEGTGRDLLDTVEVCWSVDTLVSAVAKVMYYLAPLNRPRKSDIIMNKFIDELNSRPEIEISFGDFAHITTSINKVSSIVKEILFSIPEFEELNLTQNEFDRGVKVDDDSRQKFAFTSRYDFGGSESWKDHFIDLDAFMQNVNYELLHDVKESLGASCMSCVNSDNPHKCLDLRCCRFMIDSAGFTPLYRTDFYEPKKDEEDEHFILS